MRFFTKKEFLGVSIIFLVTLFFTLFGLGQAERRARDAQRKNDFGSISDALHRYQSEFGFFPPSENGNIKACKGDNFDAILAELMNSKELDRTLFFDSLRGCEFGKDALRDVTDESYPAYMSALPSDPKRSEGFGYVYLSNTKRFQLYLYLEGGDDESGYNEGVIARNLACGKNVCNFGVSSGETPLDISVDEYEERLLEEAKSRNN